MLPHLKEEKLNMHQESELTRPFLFLHFGVKINDSLKKISRVEQANKKGFGRKMYSKNATSKYHNV